MAGVDDDANTLADHGHALADATTAALPGWVARSVTSVASAAGVSIDPADIEEAGLEAAEVIGEALRALVDLDVDDQHTTPLALVRTAVRWPTALLQAAGVPPVGRDEFDVRRFPDDPYGLTPATFADIEPDLAGLAVAWGAGKAWVHKRRHGPS